MGDEQSPVGFTPARSRQGAERRDVRQRERCLGLVSGLLEGELGDHQPVDGVESKETGGRSRTRQRRDRTHTRLRVRAARVQPCPEGRSHLSPPRKQSNVYLFIRSGKRNFMVMNTQNSCMSVCICVCGLTLPCD